MITSTVAPLLPPLRTSRSLDNLCLLASARHSPATNMVISAKSASRAPQVVVFRMLPLEDCLIPGVTNISWASYTDLKGQDVATADASFLASPVRFQSAY